MPVCCAAGLQHVHRQSGNSRPDRRTGRDANEHRVHLHSRLEVRRRPVPAVDRRRLHGQHRLDSQPVRPQSRPLLVRHRAAQVPPQKDHQESDHHDITGIEPRQYLLHFPAFFTAVVSANFVMYRYAYTCT